MKGMYSYNVLDSADYVQAKKIERRISVYDKKTRDKNARRVSEHRIEAQKNANALMTGQQSPTNQNLSQAVRGDEAVNHEDDRFDI